MLKNYILIAFRNLLKNKVFSLINIFGLAFGLTCSILISLWIWDEMSFNKFHQNRDSIYKVVVDMGFSSGSSQIWQTTQAPLGPALLDEVPEVADFTRVTFSQSLLFQRENIKFKERGYFVDTSFIKIFNFPLLEGDKDNALKELKNIVISKKLARKYFEGESAIGKTISITNNEKQDFVVSGVLKEIPSQSTLQFDYLILFDEYQRTRPWRKHWGNFNLSTFIQLRADASRETVEEKIANFLTTHKDDEENTELFLHSLNDLHLKSDFSRGREPTGRIQYVKLFSIVSGIILLIACINFMNLSTARSGKRAREVGIRKVSGAIRAHLIAQFLGESLIVAFVSAGLGLTIADLLLPAFNLLTSKNIIMPYNNGLFILSLFMISIITGLLAGSYPAIYLSSFNPVKALGKQIKSGKSLGGMRRFLVIFQFVLSIVLIIGTIILRTQIDYIKNKDLGLKKDNIIYFSTREPITSKMDVFKNKLLEHPEIKSVSFANQSPISVGNMTSDPEWDGKLEGDDINFHVIQSDHEFVSTFDIEILEGQDLPEKFEPEYNYLLVNEEAVRMMGMEDPIGQRLSFWDENPSEIVGVVKDFHHQSLFSPIEPVIIKLNPPSTWQVFIRIETENPEGIIASIEKIHNEFEQEYPFEYRFLDQQFERTYRSVSTAGNLAYIFAFLAIFVSCLGLFGLSSYMAEQRTKETGIRKVMGASVSNLVIMFSKDFLVLVILSIVIAVPVAWYLSDYWLSDFTYRIGLQTSPFLIGGVIAIIIAMVTVSFQTIKAATANPVDSLRYE